MGPPQGFHRWRRARWELPSGRAGLRGAKGSRGPGTARMLPGAGQRRGQGLGRLPVTQTVGLLGLKWSVSPKRPARWKFTFFWLLLPAQVLGRTTGKGGGGCRVPLPVTLTRWGGHPPCTHLLSSTSPHATVFQERTRQSAHAGGWPSPDVSTHALG